MFRLLVINIYSTHFLPYFEAIDRDKAFRSHTQEQTSFQLQISFSGDTLPSSLGGFSYSTGSFVLKMGFLELFSAASTPILKVLIITAIGSFLAFDSVDILGPIARKHVNNGVFFVSNPALVGSNLAETITLESMISMWFMPVNILITFIIGAALGWLLLIITKPSPHLKGLILGVCSAGNLGNLLLIIVPAVCKEKGSPFGDPDVCHGYAMAYASVSMAMGSLFVWTFVYNLLRAFSEDSGNNVVKETVTTHEDLTENLLPSSTSTEKKPKLKVMLDKMKQQLGNFSKAVNLKDILAPSTTAAIIGLIVGMIGPLRRLLIGTTAPLHVIQDSASLIGDAAIPTMTLILGANLLRGLKGSSRVSLPIVFGIVAVRLVLLPIIGIFIVKGAIYLGLVHADPLYVYVLLLQFAVPPSMNIGTITQLFGAGESECSVIMMWSYGLASVSLTVWSMFFMWLVA
ncbi:protein PIN-LIKES 3 isoform X3 [Lactuca sativa]|uniref:protein PIN-LIKES 3 isoform X3 n=1 Tax=Lactuca sativa TaxID=4236 RepID=UPI000CD810EB|nr:protein PIN-LIKES 3 isoform X3 [Lactuca sativa]